MCEQLGFSLEAPQNDWMRSDSIIQTVMPRIVSALESFNLSSRHVSFFPLNEKGKGKVGNSLAFSILSSALAPKAADSGAGRSGIICRIKDQASRSFLEFPSDRAKHYLDVGDPTTVGASDGFLRINLPPFPDCSQIADAICADIVAYLKVFPSDFSCCDLYEKCSDAGKCIAKNQDFSAGCYYKRNLMAGRVFYGKSAKQEKTP